MSSDIEIPYHYIYLEATLPWFCLLYGLSRQRW